MSFRQAVLVFSALFFAQNAACAARTTPAALEDFETAGRVKSALVNDPEVGVHAIEVRVANDIVHLTGWVPTAAMAERVVVLARAVSGVGAVRSDVRVGTDPAAAARIDIAQGRTTGPVSSAEPGGGTGRTLLAVGGAFGWNGPGADLLDASASVGPLIRVGGGSGLGPSVGFGWFGSALRSSVGPGEIIGRLRVKPVMGGLAYTVRNDRASIAFSAVAGVAFNSISPSERLTGLEVPLDVGSSFAWRPGVSLWVESSARTAVNVSVGYVMTRPRLTLLEQGESVRRRLNADAFLLRVGVVYKLF